jgi:hypothetical protein
MFLHHPQKFLQPEAISVYLLFGGYLRFG